MNTGMTEIERYFMYWYPIENWKKMLKVLIKANNAFRFYLPFLEISVKKKIKSVDCLVRCYLLSIKGWFPFNFIWPISTSLNLKKVWLTVLKTVVSIRDDNHFFVA